MAAGGSTFGFGKSIPEELPQQGKAERTRSKALRTEVESRYKKWVEEDVPYIITDGEKAGFKHLNTDDERDYFIESFWEKRNPNPGSPENAFKDEYYRRIAYTNEHFASRLPGWKTDRGRIYIMYGPPDEIETHGSDGTYNRTPEEAGSTPASPSEKWRYGQIYGVGENIVFEFVDPTKTGEFHLTNDPAKRPH